MIPFTTHRIISVAKTRVRVVFSASILAALVSLFAGLMSPYIYRSEAVVQLPAPPARVLDPMGMSDNVDILRGANVLHSPRVLAPVAESLAKDYATQFKLMVP